MENTNKKHFNVIIIGILCTVIACAATVGGIIWAINRDDSKEDEPARKGTSRTQTVSDDEDNIEKLALKNTSESDDIFSKTDKTGYVIPDGALKPGDYSGNKVDNEYDSDGLPIPDLESGEQLYIGYGDLKGIGVMKFSLCVSADKKSIRFATMVIKDFDQPFYGKTLQFTSMSRHGNCPLAIDTKEEQVLWESKVEEVEMFKDVLHVKLSDFVMNTFPDNQQMHLGEVNIWLKKATH